MRSFSIALTGLLFALPARAQEAESAAPAAPADSTEAPAAGAEAEVGAEATAKPPVVALTGATGPAPSKAPPPPATSIVMRGADAPGAADWKFDYHGYLRAPMRLGIGNRSNARPGQSSTTYHYPVVPDDQYLGWQFTSHNKKDWAEMFFSVGNSWAKGTLAVQAFNFTDAAWNDRDAQFGIGQGWVTITPDLGYENFRLELKGGAFWARYGMAGKWDAGEYDTYLFGRTHVTGELLRIEYDIDDANTIWVEHGFGVKRPDPSIYNNARFTLLNHAHLGFKTGGWLEITANWLDSWAQEEDRILMPRNHVVGTVQYGDSGQGLATSTNQWYTRDEYNPINYPSSLMGVPDGRLWVAGLDARLELSALGYFYVGYSHIEAKDAISVAPAIEVLHGFGGGQFTLGVTDNYFGPSCRGGGDGRITDGTGQDNSLTEYFAPPNSEVGVCSRGTGSVDTLLAQYDFSLTNFLQQSSGGQKFWGDGQDIRATIYGMFNKVHSDLKAYDGINKLKYGADLQFQVFPWLTVATRYDRLQPNNRIPEQSFSILSPRLVFKSRWLTREQISLQYSRYIYNERECPINASSGLPYTPAFSTINDAAADEWDGPTTANKPAHAYTDQQLKCVQPPSSAATSETFGANYLNQNKDVRAAPTTRPDVNVIKIEASMWW